MGHLNDVFRGSIKAKILQKGHDKLPMHGKGKKMSRNDVERIFRKLICEDFLKESMHASHAITLTYVSIGLKAKDLHDGKIQFKFSFAGDTARPPELQTTVSAANVNVDEQCYQELLAILKIVAKQQNIQNYALVLPLSSLREMASKLPETPEQFLQIPNVSERWFKNYGQQFLDTCKSYREIQRLSASGGDLFAGDLGEDFDEDMDEDNENFGPSTSYGSGSRSRSWRGRGRGKAKGSQFRPKRPQSTNNVYRSKKAKN